MVGLVGKLFIIKVLSPLFYNNLTILKYVVNEYGVRFFI